MAENILADVADTKVPVRVLTNEGRAVSPRRTTIQPDVIFVRNDGWSLGAPKHLEEVARSQWAGSWSERWTKRADGSWQKTWPLDPDPAYLNEAARRDAGRQTASDAIAQLNLARVGSLVTEHGLLLSSTHLPYLRELRNRIFEWSDQIEAEIARVEAES